MSKNSRKTFYLDDDKTKPLRAGGVIIYRETADHDIELLLISSRGLYEDIGGCTDADDDDIEDTVAREVEEETNEVITYDAIRDRLDDAMYVYSQRSKYIIYIVEATDSEAELKSEEFGNQELFDKINRTIHWMSVETILDKTIIKHKLNFRLKNTHLFDKLRNLKRTATRAVNMFS